MKAVFVSFATKMACHKKYYQSLILLFVRTNTKNDYFCNMESLCLELNSYMESKSGLTKFVQIRRTDLNTGD